MRWFVSSWQVLLTERLFFCEQLKTCYVASHLSKSQTATYTLLQFTDCHFQSADCLLVLLLGHTVLEGYTMHNSWGVKTPLTWLCPLTFTTVCPLTTGSRGSQYDSASTHHMDTFPFTTVFPTLWRKTQIVARRKNIIEISFKSL